MLHCWEENYWLCVTTSIFVRFFSDKAQLDKVRIFITLAACFYTVLSRPGPSAGPGQGPARGPAGPVPGLLCPGQGPARGPGCWSFKFITSNYIPLHGDSLHAIICDYIPLLVTVTFTGLHAITCNYMPQLDGNCIMPVQTVTDAVTCM